MANEAKKLQVDVVARIDKLEKAMKKAAGVTESEMGKVEKRAQTMTARLDAQFSKIGTGVKGGILSAFAGIGAGAMAALAPIALFNTALQTINDASKLVDMADKIGLSTTALQELGFGFSQAGVEASEFETGMEQFTKRIGEAATKGGRLADILKANGVALRDNKGQIRSSESLLADYADLMKNAASEAERMELATEAFGRGGGSFTVALKDGAAGLDNMRKAAAEAGGTIDEALLRRAEEMGDRWDAAWRRFKVNSQSAILTAIQGLDDLSTKFAEYEKQKNAALGGDMVGRLAGTPLPAKGDRVTGPDARVREAFKGELAKADEALVEDLRKRYAGAANKATIIPGEKEKGTKGSGRNAAAEAALREAEAVLKVIESSRWNGL